MAAPKLSRLEPLSTPPECRLGVLPGHLCLWFTLEARSSSLGESCPTPPKGGLAKEWGENMWGNNRTDLGRKGMLPMDWGRAGRLTGALGGRRAVALCGAVGGGCSGSGINRGSCSKGACNQFCTCRMRLSQPLS